MQSLLELGIDLTSVGMEATDEQFGDLKTKIDLVKLASDEATEAIRRTSSEIKTQMAKATELAPLQDLAKNLGLTSDQFGKLADAAQLDANRIRDALRGITSGLPAVDAASSGVNRLKEELKTAAEMKPLQALADQIGLTKQQFADLAAESGDDLGKLKKNLIDLGDAAGKIPTATAAGMKQLRQELQSAADLKPFQDIATGIGLTREQFDQLAREAKGDIDKIRNSLAELATAVGKPISPARIRFEHENQRFGGGLSAYAPAGMSELGAQAKAQGISQHQFKALSTFHGFDERAIKASLDAMGALQKSITSIGSTAKTAFVGASVGVMGFVTAGLAGSGTAQVLTMRMQFLSREIASVFLPIVNAVSDGIQKLTNWFRGLSGEQQDNILHWAEAAAAVGVTYVAVSKLTTALGLGTAAEVLFAGASAALDIALAISSVGVDGLTASFTLLDVASGGILPILGAFVVAIGGAAVGIGALMMTTEEGRAELKHLWEEIKKIGVAIMDAMLPAIRAGILGWKMIGSAISEFMTILDPLNLAWPIFFQMMKIGFDSIALAAITAAKAIETTMKPWKLLDPAQIGQEIMEAWQKVHMPALKIKADKREIGAPVGSFESIQDSFKRLQVAVLKVDAGGETIPQKQLTVAQMQLAAEQAIKQAIEALSHVPFINNFVH